MLAATALWIGRAGQPGLFCYQQVPGRNAIVRFYLCFCYRNSYRAGSSGLSFCKNYQEGKTNQSGRCRVKKITFEAMKKFLIILVFLSGVTSSLYAQDDEV